MAKNYRKPMYPTTKKAFVGVDDTNGNLVFADTGLPLVKGTGEYNREVDGANYPTHECVSCKKRTDVLSPRCYECREQDRELEQKMKRLSRLTREGIVPADSNNPFGDIDAEWSPNSYDKQVVEQTNKLCTNCFIVLPKAFGRKRLCESCRKDR